MSNLAYQINELEFSDDIEIQNLLHRIVSIEVTGHEQYECITRAYNIAKRLQKDLKHEEDEKLSPLKRMMNEIKYVYESDKQALEQIIDICKNKASTYKKFVEQKKAIEDQEIRLVSQSLEIKDVYIPEAPKVFKGEGANTYVSKVKKYRVTDMSKVPLEYLEVNDQAVKLAMKLGKQLEGIEYYEEEKTTLKIK